MATLRDQLQATLGDAYTIERELGGGGMSRVFVAQDTALHRPVVVKVLPPDLAAGVNVERFAREVRLAARLQHPHIVTVHAAGVTGGLPYYTMPYVEGETLRERLARGGALPVPEAVRILREVADALACAHRHGVVHRDVKPANILLSAGHALVADFGVAKALGVSSKSGNHTTPADSAITVPGFALGTPAYMAPEQALGDPAADQRVDIYAFGVVAYEALTGRVPFSAATLQALLAAQVNDAPPPLRTLRPETPPALAALVMRCLAKEPRDRPHDAADVVAALDAIAAGSAASAVPERERRGRPSRGAVVSALALAVLAVGAGGVYLARARRDPTAAVSSDERALARTALPAPTVASIAVLPLANVGGDTAEEYFADGMTDELASELGKVDGLRVAARSSAFAFKGRPVDPHDVGAKLGVAAVLEGSVRRVGRKVRVNAQLTSTRDGLTLWSDHYEREVEDVFAVQDDITRAIVAALRLRLAGAAGAPVATRGTTSVEAHDLYLKGLYFYDKFSERDLRRSLDYFDRAIARDSAYAAAWAQSAMAWGDLADDWVAPREAYPKARAAALRAIALDSTIAEAHAAYGIELLWFERDLPAAGREMRRALALNPSSAPSYFAYSAYLAVAGERDSSVAATRHAQLLDPLAPMLPARNAFELASLGRADEAIAEGRKALELDAHFALAHVALGDAYFAQGNYADALAEYRRGEGLEAVRLARTARAQAALGETDAARRTLATLERAARERYIRPEEIASVFLSLGPRDSVFAWLRRAVDARSNGVMLLASERRWDPVRDDPRFAAILREVGLAR
ncbi:MAG TPA: protein kinase [Gemmatimonadaceae bacterium]|nr:protein kinase [Gemmatimonadaceae bacterium]